ncbi:MAG: GTP pyrophosphokinase [Planctomycetota bacterium]
MATIEKAVAIAARAHAGVRDKHGAAYLLHPLRVMHAAGDAVAGLSGGDPRDAEPYQMVGVLHDVVEDTDVTLDDLRREGFAAAVIDALDLITHRPGQPYADYVIACGGNVIARQVKLADLADNAGLRRAMMRPERIESDGRRLQKYVLSYRFLSGGLAEQAYREAVSELG